MRNKSFLNQLLVLSMVLAMVLPLQAAQATTYEVINTNDSGVGSLRQAITNANNNPAADIITFAASTNGNPIVLAGASGENANASGDLDILDGGNLTIQGNGASNTLIDGGGVDRIFHVCPGGGCTNTVTLIGVTIRNGNPSLLENGGGIYHNSATLTIQHSTIGGVGVNNQAYAGGGIFNNAGTVTVDGTTISANTARGGGGIFNDATLNILNGSTIGGAGAGNQAIDGGGIFNNGTTTVDGSRVSANTADYGAGILNQASLTVQNGSTIGEVGASNHAIDGGGIYNQTGTTTINSSTVISNTATENGGGVFNSEGGTTTVDGSTVSTNTADRGSGIFNNATLTVRNDSTISANTADDNGGGIYNETGGTSTVDSSLVSDNTANDKGGGIFNLATLTVKNGSVIGGASAGNYAVSTGGGIYNAFGKTTVDGSTVSANTADYGGGIYNSSTITVTGSLILHNTATTFNGGGILNGAGTVVVDDSTVSANTAGNVGGGIYNLNGTTTVTGSRILNNTAIGDGGGIYNYENFEGATSVTGSCIIGNSAMSFLNDQPAEQFATGNWWGAATGPNTPGADSVLGNVDVSGYLTAPILNCAPDLQVDKANNTAGNGLVGVPFHWTLTVANTGLISGTFAGGQTILEDDLYPGPTYAVPIVGDYMDVDNPAHIQCSVANNTLTCTAAGGSVTLGPVVGSFEVTLTVTPGAPGTLVNPAGICRVDPDGNVIENDENNNDCPANVVNITTDTRYSYLPMVLRDSEP